MKIKLTEAQLSKMIDSVIIEQGSMFGVAGTDIPSPSNPNDTRWKVKTTDTQQKQKEDINPKKLKFGDGGNKNPKQKPDVIKLQQKLMDVGCMVTDTMKPTGYFGSVTNDALTRYNKGECETKSEKVNTTMVKQFSQLKVSNQVKKQLSYLYNNNILKNEKFTILDDKNNQVHAFTPEYKFLKTYYVITGRDKGDQLKTQSMTDWVKKNWDSVGSKFFSSLWKSAKSGFKTNPFNDLSKYIDNCYFDQKQWLIKNTPSGVFKRAGNVENFMNDWLATTFIAKDYGKRFVTWETCEGKTIPFGFHGTQNTVRLDVLDAKDIEKQACKKRNMSFGCINFNEKDVLDISKFIDANQTTIWLPDASDNIVMVPNNCTKSSFSFNMIVP